MSSLQPSQTPQRPPRRQQQPSSAVAIPDVDDDDDGSDIESVSYAPSPGAGSYVASRESWRPVPPPMLASSLDTNAHFRPHLNNTQQLSTTVSSHEDTRVIYPQSEAITYGAADPSRFTSPASAQAEEVMLQPAAVLDVQPNVTTSGTYSSVPAEYLTHTPTESASIRSKLARLLVHVRMLNEAPRELWLIYALKFLSSYSYFSLSLVLTLFLTEEFGMSDTAAGWAYGAYGLMSTFFGLLCGWFIDYLGVRASLLVGALVGAISRLVMAVTLSPNTAILMLYTFLPFAECLGIPIMTIGIKRYTNARNRTFAFSLFYSMMNIAALCAGPFVDIARRVVGDGFTLDFYALGSIRFTGLRLIILSSSIATAAMCTVVMIGVREVHVDDDGNLREFTPNREGPIAQTMRVLREPEFWRLSLFALLLVGVRMVFRHLDATLPKYLTRQFGPTAPFGLIYAINPFLIIVLVPVVGILTRKVDSLSMILGGSFVAAASPFWVCLKQSYLSVVMFMVTLSIGEAIYSPRVYEYTMEVSPHGSEGLYSSLSSAPLFSVKLLVGGMSGWLLTSFMPAGGPYHGSTLWGIIGITTMLSPVCMWLLRDYIRPSTASAEQIPSDQPVFEQDAVEKTAHIVSSSLPPSGRLPGQMNHSVEGDDMKDTDARNGSPASNQF